MLPDIDFGVVRLLAATAIFERASVSLTLIALLVASPSTKTILMMEVPMRMRSPSFSSALRTFSPLTKVPFVDPKSWIVTTESSVVILACLRDTMSSTSTMSRSDERPMMISRWGRNGNSPPWYFPEMKRNAHRGDSPCPSALPSEKSRGLKVLKT